MDFKIYFRSLDKDGKKRLAKIANTSVGYLSLVAGGHRKVSADLAIAVEQDSKRTVLCETLRPETDWAYIRGTAKDASAA